MQYANGILFSQAGRGNIQLVNLDISGQYATGILPSIQVLSNCNYSAHIRRKKKALHSQCFCSNRQLPILPGRLQPSTFGVYVLNYCVRNGNRWDHIAIITGYSSLSFSSIALSFVIQLSQCTSDVHLHRFISSFRALKKKSFAILLKILMYPQH